MMLMLSIFVACMPLSSFGLRILGNMSSDGAAPIEPDTATIVNKTLDQDKRDLLSAWCDPATPTIWHPDYSVEWSTSGCVLKADCDSPGYSTETECCDSQYAGQWLGAALAW